MKIVCVGGGPAGLYFALVTKLRDPGHDVTVFERNEADSTYGRGVTFGRDLLDKLHACDPVSAGEIQKAAFRWVGQVVDIRDEQVQRADGDGYSIGRQRLLDIMAHRAAGLGVRIEFGHEVMASFQLPEADLIVACDGANSRTRLAAGKFLTDTHVSTNKYIWLGTDKAFDSFLYAFVHTDGGWVWAYGYGVDAASSTFIVECPPETWAGLGFDVTPPDESLRLLEKLFARQLGGHQLSGQIGNNMDVRWLNFHTITNQRWYDGKVVLAGDAAHTTHYSIGWGTKLAIEDVIALAENLEEHDTLEGALLSYETQRRAALLPPQNEARCSAQWFENISRYTGLEPQQFSLLLDGRRSPLLPHISPMLYYQILRASENVAILRKIRKKVGPRAKAIYSRRGPDRFTGLSQTFKIRL